MKAIPQGDVERLLAKIAKLERQRDDARAQLKQRANVRGGSKDENRGTWCTPKAWADRVGPWDLDPFSNPRSHIVAAEACMLEHGDNGIAIADEPGTYRVGGNVHRAGDATRVFIQPPYEIVLDAIEHYGHTRFCALLRFDPSTQWFAQLYRLTSLVCVTRRRIPFEPPPGVKASAQPFPHALFYRRVEDATPAVLRACIAWRTPWAR